MRKYPAILTLLALIIGAACEKDIQPAGAGQDPLLGSWLDPVTNDSISTYRKSDSLLQGQYGFSFLAEGVFIERANAGWCGTPPITYADYEGTWTRNDSILEISVAFWGGTAEKIWKILSIDADELTIVRRSENYPITK